MSDSVVARISIFGLIVLGPRSAARLATARRVVTASGSRRSKVSFGGLVALRYDGYGPQCLLQTGRQPD